MLISCFRNNAISQAEAQVLRASYLKQDALYVMLILRFGVKAAECHSQVELRSAPAFNF